MTGVALDRTAVRYIITTRVGDLLPWPTSLLVDPVLRHVKKMIPSFHIDSLLKAAVGKIRRREPR